MMFAADDPAPLAEAIAQAREEIRLQAQSTNHPVVMDALRAAAARGVKVSVLLGPRAAYTLGLDGRPLVPRDAYGAGPDGKELRDLERVGRVFINPRFSELGADFAPGRNSSAYYMVVDGQRFALCTGSVTRPARQATLCVTNTRADLAGAAIDLHRSEAEHEATDEQARRWQTSAQRVLVVGPEDDAILMRRLAAPGAIVSTSALDEGRALTALSEGAAEKTILVDRSMLDSPAVKTLRRQGADVHARVGRPLAGTIVVSGDSAFIGSHELTDAALTRNRNVGVEVQGEDAQVLRRILRDLGGGR